MIQESQNDDLQLTQEFDSWEAASDEDWLELERDLTEVGYMARR